MAERLIFINPNQIRLVVPPFAANVQSCLLASDAEPPNSASQTIHGGHYDSVVDAIMRVISMHASPRDMDTLSGIVSPRESYSCLSRVIVALDAGSNFQLADDESLSHVLKVFSPKRLRTC